MDDRPTSAKSRSRATSVCNACRKGRIRCVVRPGEPQCVSCLHGSRSCVFDQKDGRKGRTSAKSVANDLSKRIKYLEGLLEQHQVNPSSDEPGDLPIPANSSVRDEEPGPERPTDDAGVADKLSAVKKLVPSNVRFDMASGRVRCFGPTTMMHLLATPSLNKSLERWDHHWPICTVIRDLSPETHDYLMELYWICHNAVLHLVHEFAFYDDYESGGTQFYSTFLHLTMLAMGFRYADKTRPDIRRLALPGNASSIIHERARSMVQLETEKPGGIPSIQALFLLGDLECTIGRDDMGWQFAGMSFRLVFDVGLHVDPDSLKLSEREAQIRHMVLWACILNDKYWSLYLGRPTAIKAFDIAPACLSKDFGRLIACRTFGHTKQMPTKVYESLLGLMEVVGQLCDLDVKRPAVTTDGYFKVAAVELELSKWNQELPIELRWTPENVETMPASFFLLHSQYHAALILLHRPYTKHRELPRGQDASAGSRSQNRFMACSRDICLDHAKHVAMIFEQYRKRFSLNQVFVTGLQHVGTAATALMIEIFRREPRVREELLPHLTSLRSALDQMSKTYQPANLMISLVDHFLQAFDKQGNHTSTAPRSNTQPTAFDTRPAYSPATTRTDTGVSKRQADPETSDSATNLPRTEGVIADNTDAPLPDVFPSLPVSLLEDLTAEDTAFLNMVGLDQLKHSALGELLSGSSLPWSSDLGFG